MRPDSEHTALYMKGKLAAPIFTMIKIKPEDQRTFAELLKSLWSKAWKQVKSPITLLLKSGTEVDKNMPMREFLLEKQHLLVKTKNSDLLSLPISYWVEGADWSEIGSDESLSEEVELDEHSEKMMMDKMEQLSKLFGLIVKGHKDRDAKDEEES